MYFFSQYGARTVEILVILRCVGIFVSATLPVLIIMGPKFTAIQYKNITGRALWGSYGKSGKNLSSSASNVPIDHNINLLMMTKDVLTGRVFNAVQVMPERSPVSSPSVKHLQSMSHSHSHSHSISYDLPQSPAGFSQELGQQLERH